jgi:hypothetical protein
MIPIISRYSMDWTQVSLQTLYDFQQLGKAEARRGLTFPMENRT